MPSAREHMASCPHPKASVCDPTHQRELAKELGVEVASVGSLSEAACHLRWYGFPHFLQNRCISLINMLLLMCE